MTENATTTGWNAGDQWDEDRTVVDVEPEEDGWVSLDLSDGEVVVTRARHDDGTEGQDRESYGDTQDRDSYTVSSS